MTPMARGLAAALDIGGTAPRRRLRTVPVVTAVGGRAAADLLLLGAAPPRPRWLALLNPAQGGRRLAAAWRTGRLTSALPGLAVDLVADVDRRLAETPPPADIPSAGLTSTLRWTRTTLVACTPRRRWPVRCCTRARRTAVRQPAPPSPRSRTPAPRGCRTGAS
ncbi:hypothetical protein [Streptomyces lacrimifluminis]|uniref:hypothetical protein n=1 Tax=Streptomyces lacrimifluminis TaxID=1500077 RepID=UPI001E5C0F40|nr:hypothetical protein [Streptomyces lacrimifluminis]